MKKLLIVVLLSCSYLLTFSQNEPKQHEGFYLSMCIGPVFGHISETYKSSYTEFNGVGVEFDFKIGYSVANNLIIHGTLISKTMPGPEFSYKGNNVDLPEDISLGEMMFGAGITYYFMPINIFATSSVGLGRFTINDNINDETYGTDKG